MNIQTKVVSKQNKAPLVISLLLSLVSFALCLWQLSRGWEKEAIIQFKQTQGQKQIVAMECTDAAGKCTLPEPQQQTRVKLVATEHVVWLENVVLRDQLGYRVFGIYRLHDSSKSVLVELGWVELSPERSDLPKISLSSSEVELVATASAFDEARLIQAATGEDAKRDVLQWLDYQWLSEKYPGLVEVYLRPNQALAIDGFGQNLAVIDYEAESSYLSPRVHYGYSLQWFVLGLLLPLIAKVNSRSRASRAEVAAKSDDEQKVSMRSRLPLLIMILLPLVSILASFTYYFFGEGKAEKNHGRLQTGYYLQQLDGYTQMLLGKQTWSLVHIYTNPASVTNSLYKSRQIRQALGKRKERVARYLYTLGFSVSESMLSDIEKQHPDLIFLEDLSYKDVESGLNIGGSQVATLCDELATDVESCLLLVDPNGHSVLVFDFQNDFELLLKDLKLLLKNSWIG